MLALAVIKPKKLYFNRQSSDPSDFELAKAELLRYLKHPPQKLEFYKNPPEALRDTFVKKINEFDINP